MKKSVVRIAKDAAYRYNRISNSGRAIRLVILRSAAHLCKLVAYVEAIMEQAKQQLLVQYCNSDIL